jgi:hypothetical protein
MAAEGGYDTSLTDRIQAELDGMGEVSSQERNRVVALIDRLKTDLGELISEPSRRDRMVAFLRGATPSTTGSDSGSDSRSPVRQALKRMVSLSTDLDRSSDPSEVFGVAETVAQQVHEIAFLAEGTFNVLEPKDAIAASFHRLATLCSQLIKNAVAKMKSFAKLLDVTSFSLAFATTPPSVTLTFNFGGP